MTRRVTSFADCFERGHETQVELAARLTRKYGISQASVSEAVKHGRGSDSRLLMFARKSGVSLRSFRRQVAA